jgi:hypothetical protein
MFGAAVSGGQEARGKALEGDWAVPELRVSRTRAGAVNAALVSYYLCVPKIRFCNIDGEGRQGQVVRRRRRGAQSRDGEGCVYRKPYPGLSGNRIG